MAFTWTEAMGPVAAKPAYEQMTRAAIIAACTFVDGIPSGSASPIFSCATFVIPTNAVAKELVAECMKYVSTSSAIDTQMIISTAAHAAMLFITAGGGEPGWAAVAAEIPRSRAVLTGRVARGQVR